MVQMESSNMESLSHRKTSNFSIAAIMSGIQAKTEPIEAAEPDTKNDSKLSTSDDSSDNLTGLDKVVVKKEKKSKISEECNCEELSRVNCNLDNKDLWDKFCEFGTEMIITRTGRRMFPTVRITFNDVEQEPGVKYHVVLDIPPCDNKRYRYAYHRSSWLVAGKADPAPPARLHTHPDGPYTADQLKKQVIGFEKVKITNNESDNSGQLILNSMHKFQPRVWLVKRRDGDNGPIVNMQQEKCRSYVFAETQFIAVTAYQNQCITKLKIESNPFAKGFRDSGAGDYDEPFMPSHPMGMPGMPPMPGGMPGSDPFARMRYPTEQNNNLMMAAEKARMMMMFPPVSSALPVSPPSASPCPLPLSPELLARYSALQASLQGLYNPALLAAALRTSGSVTSPPSSLNSSLSSPRSPELSPTNPHRYSPYIIPRARHSPSPSSSPVDSKRTPSPGISPPPQFPSHSFPILR